MKMISFVCLLLASCNYQIDAPNNSQEIPFLTCSNNELNDVKFYAFLQKCIVCIDKMNLKSGENLRKDWIKTLTSEGDQYFAPNWRFFKERYGKYLSLAYNDWLKHLDETERIVDDAALLIDPDELRTHIIYLEDFIEENKNFVAIADVKARLKWYLNVYLNGVDNSLAYDRKNRCISPKFRASYERFLRKNKKSKYFQMVQQRSVSRVSWGRTQNFLLGETN